MIYMKKLVAISVLFALLAVAVFAQDGGWSNPWKVGLTAKYFTDMFYAAKADGSEKVTTENTGDPTMSMTTEYGAFQKGVVHFFPNEKKSGANFGDYRIGLQLSNEGENYAVRVNIDWDGWGVGFDAGKSVFQFLQGNSDTDWGIKGTAGVFSLGLGPWATEAAWVGTQAIWGSYMDWNHLNRFGVRRADGGGQGNPAGWLHSDHFRSGDVWGTPFSVGIGLGDNFKFTLGYNLRPSAFGWSWSPGIGDPTDSKSSINGKFMISGKPVDAITFDLFYSVIGSDSDTRARPINGVGYSAPEAYWRNLIGAYVGVNAIENLALSVGYTVSFNAYEAGSFLSQAAFNAATGATPPNDPALSSQAVTYNAPIYSGIDLRVAYSGIDKIGLKFLTNVSLANTGKGEKYKDAVGTDIYKDKVTLAFAEAKGAGTLAEGRTEDWFSWHAILQSQLGFIDGVGLEVSLGNLLTVNKATEKRDNYAAGVVTNSIDHSYNTTENQFRFTVGATYGVGNVTLGAALWLGLDSTVVDNVEKTTTAGSGSVKKVTTAGTKNEVKFGIPISFQVSF
jgi:hypothetical protein